MRRVIADDEEIIDSVILGKEKLGKSQESRHSGVLSSEEWLLDEPFIDKSLKGDFSVQVERIEEGDSLLGINVDQSGVNED